VTDSPPTPPSLAGLRGSAKAAVPSVPRPPSRWKTRVLLPLFIILAAGGLLLYTARAALWPHTDVWVVPVVAKPASAGSPPEQAPGQPPGQDRSGPGAMLVQAPGWIEPAPYAISVPVLTGGVVSEVLVIEGQRVEAGQVVARLVDDDAKLALRRAAAELNEHVIQVQRADADLHAAQARRDETRDEATRKRPLVEAGGISEGQLARLDLRLRAMDMEVESADAAAAAARAAVSTATVARDEAQLLLDRTQIRAPITGVVLSRQIEPGSRISMAPGPGEPGGGMTGSAMRLYDPASLQVRVDISLADTAKIAVGSPAQIITEALPDSIFSGTLTSFVHQADIQRNTVQVKVSIHDPVPTLKPEMLTRVRLYAATTNSPGQPSSPAAATSGGLRLLVPAAAVFNQSQGRARAWVVEQTARGPVAGLRDLTLGSAADAGYLDIAQGLNPGDRLIIDPPAGLAPGSRLRILGEKGAPS